MEVVHYLVMCGESKPLFVTEYLEEAQKYLVNIATRAMEEGPHHKYSYRLEKVNALPNWN